MAGDGQMISQGLFYFWAYLFLSIQTANIQWKFFFHHSPDFMLILVVLHGLEYGVVSSIFFAFFTGVLLDCFSPGTFGLNALALTVCAYSLKYVSRRIYRERLINRLLLIFVFFCIRDILLFLKVGDHGLISMLSGFFRNTIPSALWTTLWALIIIPLLDLLTGRIIRERIQHQDEE